MGFDRPFQEFKHVSLPCCLRSSYRLPTKTYPSSSRLPVLKFLLRLLVQRMEDGCCQYFPTGDPTGDT